MVLTVHIIFLDVLYNSASNEQKLVLLSSHCIDFKENKYEIGHFYLFRINLVVESEDQQNPIFYHLNVERVVMAVATHLLTQTLQKEGLKDYLPCRLWFCRRLYRRPPRGTQCPSWSVLYFERKNGQIPTTNRHGPNWIRRRTRTYVWHHHTPTYEDKDEVIIP